MTRLLEDAWPAGALAPHRFVDDLRDGPQELRRFDVVSGHLGTLAATGDRHVVTLLRDPVRRAWSHYKAYRSAEQPRFATLTELLDDPIRCGIGRNYQARWLAIAPRREPLGVTGLPPSEPGLTDDELEARAREQLGRCALVGTVERIDEFVEALARLVGRPLPSPPRLNVGIGPDETPVEEAERVRAQSKIDERLVAVANDALDRALDTLPELPRERVVSLPYRQGMEDAFHGTGWHARMRTEDAGWHRWSGPGVRSEMRLPVRAAGPARLHVALVSACDDEAVRSLRVEVQRRAVEHRFEDRPFGTAVVCDVELDPTRPLTIELEVPHTRHLVDAATGEVSPDPAGVAVGDVLLEPR